MKEDFELTLFDRLEVIRQVVNQYGEDKFYISYSGGKDSTVLSYLIDLAMPENKIPRVFINTGIEYVETVKFVKNNAENDSRIQILTVGKNIPQTLQKHGYPFKSKEHSLKIFYFKKGMKTGIKYRDRTDSYGCPKKLRYQFDDDFTLNISNRCCYEFKKNPIHEYEKETGRIPILALRQAEGGERASHGGCILKDDKGIKKFKPLNPVSDEFMQWVIDTYNVKLSRMYTEYGFTRTGCVGCPYNLNLQKDLDTLRDKIPSEYRRAEYLWKPVYDEYRRIGYRLNKIESEDSCEAKKELDHF